MNKDEFDIFFKNNYRKLCFFAHKFTHDHELAEDITVDAFVKLFNSCDYYTEWQRINFVCVTIKNLCQNYYKNKKRRSEIEKEIPFDDVEYFDAKILQAEVMHQIVEKCKQLPENFRSVIYLIYGKGLSTKEAAKVLKTTEDNIRMIKKRAVDRLKEQFKNQTPPSF